MKAYPSKRRGFGFGAACLGGILLVTVGGACADAQERQFAERENLGPMVNTSFDEVYPIISPDGKILFFVRKDYPGNIDSPKADIWFSRRLEDGGWSIAENIGRPLNNKGYNYVCYVFPDNNSLLLGNQYFEGDQQGPGVSIAKRTAEGWSMPRNQHIRGFRNKSRFAEFTVSPDGNVLIMSIENERSHGKRDIFVSFREDDTTWTEPEVLPTPLNSPQDDITPYLAADGKTLYFSSDRPGGFGSNDVYMSRRLDDTWRSWSEPRNLGYPVNTPDWDAYYSVPASGEYAYFVSTASSIGLSDIFRIRLAPEHRPTPVLMITGVTKDDENHPIPATVYFRKYADTARFATAVAHPTTGRYTIALPAGEEWEFHAEYEGYYPISEHLDLRDLREYREENRDLVLVPTVKGRTIRLNNIFFEFDKADLLPTSVSELERLVHLLRTNPAMRIHIGGHTDSVGTFEYNISLSRARAKAVVRYLVLRGISADRLTYEGYGEYVPIAPNETEEGRALNRRVEFTIL
ncbi:MAG: OmpA family protein [Bacteroidota bacterium]|nr:OmpA family protein [Bacteroidota bacterium]